MPLPTSRKTAGHRRNARCREAARRPRAAAAASRWISSVPAMLDQAIEKRAALGKLVDGAEFVGLVRLIDVSGSDHHRRNPGFREQARLGAVSHLLVVLAGGQLLHQADDVEARLGLQPGKAGLELE